MQDILVKDIANHLGTEVRLKGWVRNIRHSGKLLFIIFRDGSAEVQAVAFKPELGEEIFEGAKRLTLESSLIITGIPKEHQKKAGEYELAVTGIQIVQIADEYPISKKEHGPDFLLSNRHLWIRSPKQWAILRIRHTVYFAICEYLNDNNFFRFDSPILTPNACEGTTTLFELEYFDEGMAYLSQSGQLYLETGIMSLGRVYDFGPVFRAERSKTRKHLTEFWMMDAEAAYVEHEENMDIQEGLIRHVIRKVLATCDKELDILERDKELLKAADAPFKRMTHFEAIEYLRSQGSEIDHDSDLGATDEVLLTEGSAVPVFIEKWPKNIKAFYMRRAPEDENLVLGSDLIAPEGFGEIIGGSERETDYEALLARMKEEKMDLDAYQWFLDLRKYGSVPHSGFGIGLERLVTWMSGTHHIRETIPFPRMIYRIYP
ncbi:MAG: asparagine--tRNA ligase [Candidatus Cloacimonadales bacterium]|jgi:asparaginyl-tRNA synthetase|nr:asparagine--tRNA ligase [Candidatus Cloacimonadota bacterium]MDY0380545.1 asparagine--tRNA ligase [Candidatus Cloacimonadaceae bacterium]HCM15438.1 asparagine--tRNA ligase [Candidatus Cloacimonas sp.]MCB5256165.1 asparagine--tRNA ligase [Candidatus Cloacimonadota bacterium]MCB5263803.1 asparagine--tRNA ligase [Candidatus Cloacimonadota bacterium]